MLNYSQIIKIERLKQNMTQQSLAQGICSTSYLSKIEKEHVLPREHIKNALLKKLQLDVQVLKIEQEEQFIKKLEISYEQAIFIDSIDYAQSTWDYFNQYNIEFLKIENFYLCNLYLQRIAIIARQPFLETDELEAAFKSFFDKLTIQQQFIYYVNCCHYSVSIKSFEKAVEYMKVAQELLVENETLIKLWQIGDFKLLCSYVYHSIFKYSTALVYTKEALEIFKKLDLQTPIINCYIRLGITNNRAGFTSDAQDAFKIAYEFALESEKKDLYGKILQNIGYNSALLGNSKEAISYYKESLLYKKAVQSKLITIHSIIKEYSKLNNSVQVKKWCDKGFVLLEEYGDVPQYKLYLYHFKIFEMLHEIKPIDSDFLKEAIDFFLNSHEYLLLQKYTYVLAEFFMKNNNFEEATKYFKCSSEIGFKIQNRNNWQDL